MHRTHRYTHAQTHMHQHMWTHGCMHMHPGVQYTHVGAHIHRSRCTYIYTPAPAHVPTWMHSHIHRCTHTHMQVHIPPCMHAYTNEATKAFPVEHGLGYSVCFPSLQRKVTWSIKNHSSCPWWMGGAPGSPRKGFRTAGVCVSGESGSMASFSHQPPAGVHSHQWRQFAGSKIDSTQCPERCNLPHRRDHSCSQENIFPSLLTFRFKDSSEMWERV